MSSASLRRIFADDRRQLDDAYATETERERRTFEDARQQHKDAYVQFRSCMQHTRSDLQETATLREQAAALKAKLKVLRAAAAAAIVPPGRPNTAVSVDVPGSTSAAHQISSAAHAGYQTPTGLSCCKIAGKCFTCFNCNRFYI